VEIARSRRRLAWLAAVALGVASSALADTATLTAANTAKGTSKSPVTMLFPVTRATPDLSYQAVLDYHTVDGTALAGTDYAAAASWIAVPPGTTGASIPVTLTANTGSSGSVNFQVVLDHAFGIGPNASFGTQTTFGTGAVPTSVTAADLNGDGTLDLIVANLSDNKISVLLNTTAPGATTPSFSAQTTFTAGSSPVYVTAVDLNGDGKPDVIVANQADNTVSVLLNTTAPGATTPSFAAQQTFATGAGPVFVATADINGDGLADLVTANANGNGVSVLLNTTTPGSATLSFAAHQDFAAGSLPRSVAAADVNGDGKPDLIVANRLDNTVSVLLNTTAPGAATPSFAAQQTFATGSAPSSVSAADLNGDGRPDVIVADASSGSVSVLVNTTAPGASSATFSGQQTFAAGNAPSSVTSADVNGDGKPDLIVANQNSNTLSVLLNTTAPGATMPSFAAGTSFGAGMQPGAVIAADINGDGKLDLLVANSGDNTVSALLNTTPLPTGGPNFAAQQTFAVGTGPWNAVAFADLNGDGKVDVIVPNEGSNSISVLLNTTAPGAATQTFTQQTFSVGREPTWVAATDLNGDGKPDIVVVNFLDNDVSVFLNTTPAGASTATFAAPQTFASGNLPMSVTVADINGDGKPDLVIGNSNETDVSVLLNTMASGASTPSFAAQQPIATDGQFSPDVAVADVDGDGKPDLIVTYIVNNVVAVLLNTTASGAATASFAASQTFATGAGPQRVIAADMNGDGKPDIVVSDVGNPPPGTTVAVLINTSAGAGTPSFAAPQAFDIGTQPGALAAADLNGDGRLDLVVGYGTGNAVAVLFNTTTPGASPVSFEAAVPFAVGNQVAGIGVADLNGDGKPDVVANNRNDNTISVLRNTAVRGSGASSFAAQQTYATGNQPKKIIAADLNADGRPDVITVNSSDNTFSVLLDTTAFGATTTTFAAPQTFATGTLPYGVAVGDVNGDGKLDVIVANRGSGTLSVFLNTTAMGAGTLSFAAAQTFTVGTGPQAVAVADVNGDGKPDLIAVNTVSNSISVLLNTTSPGSATPSFAAQVAFATGSGPTGVAVADVNGDGMPDLVVANGTSGTVSVLFNTAAPGASAPSFAAQQTFTAGAPQSVAAVDVNGDGRPDLVVASGGSNAVLVLLNTTSSGASTASFTTAQTFAVGTGPRFVAIADVNGDGRPDVITANANDNTVSVLLNNTAPGSNTPSFFLQQTAAVGSFPVSVATADVNGDGKPDLVVANNNAGTVSVLLNSQYQVNFTGSPATGTIVHDYIFADGFGP